MIGEENDAPSHLVASIIFIAGGGSFAAHCIPVLLIR